MLQNKIPQKLKNSRSFTISCSIRNKHSGKALCNLRAINNLMALSVFKQFRPTTMILQLANKSHAYLKGKIEDVLVKVDKFIFPVDLLMLGFEADKKVLIILGRPFLVIRKTQIHVQKGELIV